MPAQPPIEPGEPDHPESRAARPAAEPSPELLLVGRIVAPQGLQGELRVLPLSDFPQRFCQPGPRWLRPGRSQGQAAPNNTPRLVQLLSGRALPGKELFVVRLAGVDKRTSAEALVGQELLVEAAERPPLAPGEFHLLDLLDLEVRLLPQGTPIGRITDLIHGGNDLLEVELNEPGGRRGRRVLVPFVEAIVPEVEPAQGWVGITPPQGLLDL